MCRGLSPGQTDPLENVQWEGILPPIRFMLISQYYYINTLTDYIKQELT